MRLALLASAVMLVPAVAAAQQGPAFQANAAANATPDAGASASAFASMPVGQAGAVSPGQPGQSDIPPGMPPALRVLSPSARLNVKEARGVGLARRWAGARYMPQAGADGVVRFAYGATLPTVVCAPLQVCDLRLQPGEVVNNINAGDKIRWSIMPGISGSPEGNITHLLIKPSDAGLVSSMTVLTDRRSYSIKLVSTQSRWMPHVGFSYPDDQQRAWAGYQQTVGAAAAYGGAGGGYGATVQSTGAISFFEVECKGSPYWHPRRAWTDGTKTYVEFPSALTSGAVAFVGLANDGGWFNRPSTQVINYRPMPGNRYMADGALERAALIGAGGEQRCTLTREARR